VHVCLGTSTQAAVIAADKKTRNLAGSRIVLGLVVVMLVLVVHFAAPSSGGLWLRTLYDSMHVPVFGVIALCVLLITPVQWGTRNRLLATTGIVLVLSLLSELAQIPTSRDASVKDLLSNWLGAAGFTCIAVVFLRSFPLSRVRGLYLALLGFVLIAWPLLPLAKVSAAYVERFYILPSLIRFDSRLGETLFRMQNAKLTVQNASGRDRASANILLKDGPWPGIVFHDAWPDWQPYQALIIKIENPEVDVLTVNVRVHDRDHDQRYADRFHRRIELATGVQTVRINMADIESAPDSRKMNMSEIDGLIIFANRKESGRRFVLHDIRLE